MILEFSFDFSKLIIYIVHIVLTGLIFYYTNIYRRVYPKLKVSWFHNYSERYNFLAVFRFWITKCDTIGVETKALKLLQV